MTMLHWTTVLFLLAGSLWLPAYGEPLPEGLAQLAREHRYPLHFRAGAIAGTGGERLLTEAHASPVLMFGENHGLAEIAHFATALYRDLSANQPRRVLTEIGPASAHEVERMLRAGELRGFLAQGTNLHALPFFSWAEELPLPEAAVAAFPASDRAIWGVDQEFIAAAPLLLPRLAELASTPSQHDAIAAVRRASWLNPFLFGMGSGKALHQLAVAFAGSGEGERLSQDLQLTHRIYREQMGGDGAWSNARRETLMMENFLNYTEQQAAPPGPLFAKFGAFHLFRGSSPTVPEAFGAQLSRWAEERGLRTLNLFAECAGGRMREGLFGREVPCEAFLTGRSDGFHDLLLEGAWTLFDLRPLRAHPALADASGRVQLVIQGYDYLLLVPEPSAATFLPGTLVTHRYGLIVLGTGLLLVLLLGVLLRRWWQRRRRARI